MSVAPILEMAVLDVRAGQEKEFEAAFDEAKSIIAAAHGFQGLELRHCVEHENRYLLLISWATLDDHVVGFRQGPDYPRWKALLHHFYDPHPTVEHFEPVATA